jgi:hypothetical protein
MKTHICINIREMRMTWTDSSFIGYAMQIKSDIYEGDFNQSGDQSFVLRDGLPSLRKI